MKLMIPFALSLARIVTDAAKDIMQARMPVES